MTTTFNQPGYSFNSGGTMIGADYRAGDHLVFGLVGTYVNASTSSNDGASVDVNGGKIGAYGTWWKEGTYVQGYGGGGFDSFDTHRTIYLPGYMGGSMTPGATGGTSPVDSGYRVARGDTDGGRERQAALPLATIGSSGPSHHRTDGRSAI